MTKVYINIDKLKNTPDFDPLTPAMKAYLDTYQGKLTFESQIAEMPEKTKRALETQLEEEDDLCDLISMSFPNIPVRIHGNLYDLKSALRLLRDGDGVATDVKTNEFKFTYADIQPDWQSKKRIEKLINEVQLTLDNNAPESTPSNNNMPLPAPAVDSSLRSLSSAVDSLAPQVPISEKPEEYQFYDEEDALLEAKVPQSEELSLPPSPNVSFGFDQDMFSGDEGANLMHQLAQLGDRSFTLGTDEFGRTVILGQYGEPLGLAAEELIEQSMIDSDVEDDNSQNHAKQEAIYLKMVVVGAAASDKIGLLYRYMHGTYPAVLPTFMDNQTAFPLSIDDNEVLLSLWNVAGQEEYDRLRPLSYPSTDVFILTYSVMDPESFNEIETKWAPELRKHCPEAKIILVGCNKDPEVNAVSPITSERVQQVARKIGAVAHIECSARTGYNVENVFLTAARIGYEQEQKVQAKIAQQSNPFRLFSSLVDKMRGDDSPAKHHKHKTNSTEDLIAELEDYIRRREKKGEQSVFSSFLGGAPMTTKTGAARDAINTLRGNPGCKPFSAYSKTKKDTLLTGKLGDIINRYPAVVAQIKGEEQLASRGVSARSSRNNHS